MLGSFPAMQARKVANASPKWGKSGQIIAKPAFLHLELALGERRFDTDLQEFTRRDRWFHEGLENTMRCIEPTSLNPRARCTSFLTMISYWPIRSSGFRARRHPGDRVLPGFSYRYGPAGRLPPPPARSCG